MGLIHKVACNTATEDEITELKQTVSSNEKVAAIAVEFLVEYRSRRPAGLPLANRLYRVLCEGGVGPVIIATLVGKGQTLGAAPASQGRSSGHRARDGVVSGGRGQRIAEDGRRGRVRRDHSRREQGVEGLGGMAENRGTST
jgi:hypothetical protein